LEQGFPQNWIYIERKVRNALNSGEAESVKTNENVFGNTQVSVIQGIKF